MTDKLSALIETFKHQLENGGKIDPDAAREMLLAISIDTHTEVKHINGRLKKVEAVTDKMEKRPSLLALFHKKPKRMVTALVSFLLIWSVICHFLWESKLVPVLAEWLGLPPLFP